MKFYNNQPRVEKVIAIFQNILIFGGYLYMFTIESCAHIFVECFRYSPFLNVTEYAGSYLKADLKRILTNPVIQTEISTQPAPDSETANFKI